MDTQTPALNDAITHASLSERQAVLTAYLDWLDDPASQERQCFEELYHPDSSQCCALGGLGQVLAQHGYARKVGINLEVFLQGEFGGGPLRTSVSSYKLPIDALAALGLERHQGEIMRLNDTHRFSFAAIAARLRELGVHAPEALP
ncbi:hypothetical protein [Deinococcus saxicola]|uniref:hypothetical protein n=1 Tax=Deinococcus saxicola TaxID=249406 RepID=UPI0039F07319